MLEAKREHEKEVHGRNSISFIDVAQVIRG
jgi:hypothetical protein